MRFKPEELAIMLEEAKQYTDSQKLGGVETKVITWDGNTKGKYCVDLGAKMALVSDVPIGDGIVKHITAIYYGAEEVRNYKSIITQTLPDDNGEATISMIMATDVVGFNGQMICAISVSDDCTLQGILLKKGLYFNYFEDDEDGGNHHIFQMEIETIHQIDLKFIPGLIPVIELTTPYPMDGTPVALTAEENELLNATSSTKLPAVIRLHVAVDTEPVEMALLFGYGEVMSDEIGAMKTYSANTRDGTNFYFNCFNGEWIAAD